MGCAASKVYTDSQEPEYDMTPIRHLPVIFVNGVPGAGNQTVAQTISNITGYTMIKPGDLVREEAQKDSDRGRFIADKINNSECVPEQVIMNLIKEALLSHKEATGFILVGFPKNSRMSVMFNKQVKWPEKVVALEVDNEVATTRLERKLSELGRSPSEIRAARHIVKEAAHTVKSVHKRFGGQVVTVNSTDNPTSIAQALKEALADTMKSAQAKTPSSTTTPEIKEDEKSLPNVEMQERADESPAAKRAAPVPREIEVSQ